MDTPETLNIADAAGLLHADSETVMHLARCGELPGAKIGKSWVFLRVDVLTFLSERIRADTARRRQANAAQSEALAQLLPASSRQRRRPPPALPSLPVSNGTKGLP